MIFMANLSLTCTAYIPDLFWIVLIMMFSVVAVIFMLGKILTRTDFEAMAKVELREAILSAVIAFGAVGLSLVLCDVTLSLIPIFGSVNSVFQQAGAEIPDHFRPAETYLSALTNNVGVPMIMNLEALAFTSYLAQTTIRSTTGVNFLAALGTLSSVIGIFVGLIFTPMIASINVQLISLSLAKAVGLAVVLPAGIVARAFKFTREAGGFLIALGIGMYFLWPLLYVINYEVSLRMLPGLTELVAIAPPTNLSAFPSPDMVNIFIDQIFNNFSRGSQLLMQGVVLPMLNVTLFVGFIRIFSEFISGLK